LRYALDFLLEMRERYGDVVSVPTLVGPFTLIFHPDGVRYVLQENHRNYNKDVPDYQVLSLVLEARLILATILSRYQLRLLPEVVVTPEPLVTLRPRGDLLMTVRRTLEMK
jgi:cytochrome P450